MWLCVWLLCLWPAASARGVGTQLRPRDPFYRLPVFWHVPGPMVAQDLFRPVPGKRALPGGLTALLFPPTPRPRVQRPGARAVEVWCGVHAISVRVSRLQVRGPPHLVRLGSCQASVVNPDFLYFRSRLTECGGKAKVAGGQLVYTYLLRNTPPQQGHIIRDMPLELPIHCHYNRFHYSYQVGFRPQVHQSSFRKTIQIKRSFSLTVCNAHWEPISTNHRFSLGEPVYFVAETSPLLAKERLYVDFCYATNSEDPNGVPKVDIVSNSGCMTDSRREGSRSRFWSVAGNVAKFSVDAFLFRSASQVLYLHCSMAVSLTTSPTSKSCSYNMTSARWEELEALHSVCSCCDSMCTEKHNFVKSAVSSRGWHIGQKEEKAMEMSLQAEKGKEWRHREKSKENLESRPKKMKNKALPQEKNQLVTAEPSEPFVADEEWRLSTSTSQQEKWDNMGQMEMVVEEEGSQPTWVTASDMFGRKGHHGAGSSRLRGWKEVASTNNGSVSFVTANITPTSSIAWDYNNTSHHASTTGIPVLQVCSNTGQTNCSTINITMKTDGLSSERVTDIGPVGTERFAPNNTTRSIKSGLIHPTDSHLEPVPTLPGLELRTNRLMSESKSVSGTVETSPTTSEPAAHSAISKGPGGDVIHSHQTRRSESDQSAQGLPAGSDFESGSEVEPLNQSVYWGS